MAKNTVNETLLGEMDFFRGCSAKELREIARLVTVVDLDPGEVLMRQDHSGNEFFLLISGEAEVRRNGKVVATLGPGDIAGELALLDRKPRSATVVATTPSQAALLGTREFWSAISLYPAVDRQLLEHMTKRIRDLDATDQT